MAALHLGAYGALSPSGYDAFDQRGYEERLRHMQLSAMNQNAAHSHLALGLQQAGFDSGRSGNHTHDLASNALLLQQLARPAPIPQPEPMFNPVLLLLE